MGISVPKKSFRPILTPKTVFNREFTQSYESFQTNLNVEDEEEKLMTLFSKDIDSHLATFQDRSEL